MSNNINDNEESYKIISSIDSLDFKNKTILILGAGWMARQYAIALKKMNVNNVTIFSRNEEKSISLCNEFGFEPLFGDPKEALSKIPKKDLTIVSTSINSLIQMTKHAINAGQKNILVEKPGSLYYKELFELLENFDSTTLDNIKFEFSKTT